MFVVDDCIVDEYDIASFISQLDEMYILDLDDISMSMPDDHGRDEDH